MNVQLNLIKDINVMMLVIMACGMAFAADKEGISLKKEPPAPVSRTPFRGVHFNPLIQHKPDAESIDLAGYPWLCLYPEVREQVCNAIDELVRVAGINLVDVYVAIPYSLKIPSQAPQEGRALTEWANTSYLDNVAAFVDDCYKRGVSVELDLACNMWIPYSTDPSHQIANTGHWPMPDETPWNESALWYRETIRYIEGRVKHPEGIAMWCMTGNYEIGQAEPCLWEREDNPSILSSTEEFVKRVWPVFWAAGTRPKAAPFLLPILSNEPYWMAKPPEARLSGFTNLKKWLLDDLGLPPDYWPMSTWPCSDPASDGVYYIRKIVEILGRENASRILSTDFVGPGHDAQRKSAIISTDGYSGPEIFEWQFKKCMEYGFAGWWIWAYQDTPDDTPWNRTGIRDLDGKWKTELVQAIKKQSNGKQQARRG